jgi:membrane complex biogenesis BtpA family protein
MDPIGKFRDRLGSPRALIAMVHVGALPGTPSAREPLDAVIARAVAEALIYREEGCTAIGLENMHDRPYLKSRAGPEVVAAMTAVAREVRRAAGLPIGIQVLAGANREAVAVALAASADFVRVEGFVFAHVADEGLIEGCAGDLLRYRRAIGAEHVLIFADVKKKHAAHAITADVSIAETARAAEFFLADGVIVSGAATGVEASPDEVQAVAGAVATPVLVGSGITAENLHRFRAAHGFIVGTSLKDGGQWDRPVDREAVRRLVRACAALGEA